MAGAEETVSRCGSCRLGVGLPVSPVRCGAAQLKPASAAVTGQAVHAVLPPGMRSARFPVANPFAQQTCLCRVPVPACKLLLIQHDAEQQTVSNSSRTRTREPRCRSKRGFQKVSSRANRRTRDVHGRQLVSLRPSGTGMIRCMHLTVTNLFITRVHIYNSVYVHDVPHDCSRKHHV
jgi:hypothetical protein